MSPYSDVGLAFISELRALPSWVLEMFLVGFADFWGKKVPMLLQHSARSLAQAKIPKSLDQAHEFSMNDWIKLAPVVAALFACTVTPFALLLADNSKVSAKTRLTMSKEAEAKSKQDVAESGQKWQQAVVHSESDLDLRDSYFLTRDLLLRGMGLCYFCGFLVSAVQHRALWGSLGLLPHGRTSNRPMPAFALLDYLGWGYGDWQLELVSWIGVALASQMILGCFRSFLIPAVLWVLYLSIINLQAPFTFSYGWEWLTCELGFLCIFLCPVCARGLASWTPPPRLVLWLIRWCAFRLLLGAGMSKVGRNSSACWRELTCTTTHYYTQPVPNPLSWHFHHLPASFHHAEVAMTFVEQLVLPFFMLIPMRTCRLLAGVLEMGFQLAIVGTGNYAWINFIGALPCVALLDDAFLGSFLFLPRRITDEVHSAVVSATLEGISFSWKLAIRVYRSSRCLLHLALVMVMVYKSVDPVKDMFGPAPWINSYDQWFLMNSQGVFGFINQHRVQVILKYTHHESPSVAPSSEWKHLDFKCLPGTLDRRPCLMSPYHYRLDWETWIRITASLESLWDQKAPAEAYHQHTPEFLQSLIVRILSGDDDAAGLMGVPIEELYKDGVAPTAVSVDFASYTFTDKATADGVWWKSEPIPNALRAYGGADTKLPSEQIRKSPRSRHWILGICAIGVALGLETVSRGSSANICIGVCVGFLFLHVFLIALLSDYLETLTVATWFMPEGWIDSATRMATLADYQRLCYSNIFQFSRLYSTLGWLVILQGMYMKRLRGYPTLISSCLFGVLSWLASSAMSSVR